MGIPAKCAVKGCDGNAFVMFGDKFICGNCFMKIQEKQKAAQQAMLDELEVEED